jgi:hypothetical protein
MSAILKSDQEDSFFPLTIGYMIENWKSSNCLKEGTSKKLMISVV